MSNITMTASTPTTQQATRPRRSSSANIHNLNAAAVFARLGMPERGIVAGSLDFDNETLTAYPTTANDAAASITARSTPSPITHDNDDIAPPTSAVPIEQDILLPFSDRPSEVKTLLEDEPLNCALLDMLKETFAPRQASSGWTYAELQACLAVPRNQLCDQDWIDELRAHVAPRSSVLWERLRACLGIDVDDERGGDRFEPLSSDMFVPMLENAEMDDDDGTTPGMDATTPGVDDYLTATHLSPRAVLRTYGSPAGMLPPPAALTDSLPSSRAVSDDERSYNDAQTRSDVSARRSSLAGYALQSHSSSSGRSDVGQPSPRISPTLLQLTTMSPPLPPAALSRSHPASSNPASPASSALSSQVASPANASAVSSVGTSPTSAGSAPAATRMHRRTSSGGSAFRRAFAMSSINENEQVNTFDDRQATPTPFNATEEALEAESGPATVVQPPSSGFALSNLTSPSAGYSSSHRVDIGGLLHLRAPSDGATLPIPLQSAGTPGSSALSLSSASPLSNGSFPRSPQHEESALSTSTSSQPIAAYDQRKQANYDDYAVFESEDGESVSGSIISRGRGPGVRILPAVSAPLTYSMLQMRFSFGAVDVSSPQSGVASPNTRKTGFALSAFTNSAPASRSTPKSHRSHLLDGNGSGGSGQSTPKPMSPVAPEFEAA